MVHRPSIPPNLQSPRKNTCFLLARRRFARPFFTRQIALHQDTSARLSSAHRRWRIARRRILTFGETPSVLLEKVQEGAKDYCYSHCSTLPWGDKLTPRELTPRGGSEGASRCAKRPTARYAAVQIGGGDDECGRGAGDCSGGGDGGE